MMSALRLGTSTHRTTFRPFTAAREPRAPSSRCAPRAAARAEMAAAAQPQQLWRAITQAYARARELGAAKTTDSVVEVFDDADYKLQYVLRILANLAEKKATKPQLDGSSSPPKNFRNPFLP
jgi:hypothetical protein